MLHEQTKIAMHLTRAKLQYQKSATFLRQAVY